MSLIAVVVSCLVAAQGPVLGIDGTHFTLDGKPTFLLGISYYAALGIDDEAVVNGDLDAMRRCGFNWMRVWATWDGFDSNVGAVAPDGAPREPCLGRLDRLCGLAGRHGMVVDVTVYRGKHPGAPENLAEHIAEMKTLARALEPYRNVYFDVANERNIGDARHVPMSEVGQLIAAVKAIGPDRLCTASEGGDISDEEAARYLTVGHVDFLAPHRGRYAGSAQETAERTQHLLAFAAKTRPVPVHCQEPFRRGYSEWQPSLDDFKMDLEQARNGGAAGWCFHNGGTRGADDERPRRSFDLRTTEPRLFDQFDPVEQAFLDWLRAEKK